MAIDMTRGGSKGTVGRRTSRNVYTLSRKLKAADVSAAKGTALANGDVIQIWDIPANSCVLFGGFEVTKADTKASADVLGQLGTTVDPDQWVAATTLGSTGVKTSLFVPENPFNAATTVDLTLSQTAAFSANDDWEISVWVLVTDIGAFADATSADASTTG